jgi:hypothetical protein
MRLRQFNVCAVWSFGCQGRLQLRDLDFWRGRGECRRLRQFTGSPEWLQGCVLSAQRRACFRPGTASGLRGFREKEEGARLAFRHPPS